MKSPNTFSLECRSCSRLAGFLDQVRDKHPDYHARPVAPFGTRIPRLLIVGLAPGYHGANATGRPFTGDYAGILLYKTLYKNGFSDRPESVSRDDGLVLRDCRITNAVKCLPPENKPTGTEVRMCNRYLSHEIDVLRPGAVIVALGGIAHGAVLRALGLRTKDYPFGHARDHTLPGGRWLVDSYHCSRYNTQTRRLTEFMFNDVFVLARSKLSDTGAIAAG